MSKVHLSHHHVLSAVTATQSALSGTFIVDEFDNLFEDNRERLVEVVLPKPRLEGVQTP